MMKTKEDFQQTIAQSVSNYPTAAQLYRARDPRLLAQLDAMAAMLAMMSAEQDVAAMEPWTKARDVTVLADAAVKGILPFGKPSRVRVRVQNGSAQPLQIVTGRFLQDVQGRTYVVDAGATMAAGATGFISAFQRAERTPPISHTVTVSQPFYRLEVPAPEAGKHIADVTLRDAAGNAYRYTPEFVNVGVGERVFHLETDESRRLYIKLGATGIVGYQPSAGEVLTLVVTDTEGAYELSPGSPFSFQYSYSRYDAGATMTLEEVLSPGAAPMDIGTMREVTAYPSIYDGSAVYQGNFDYLVRRNLAPFRFLSVWNEQTEERIRGANDDSINCLFVAARKDGVADAALQSEVTAVILEADDSYRVKWVPVVVYEIPVAITARVQAAYDFGAIAQQVREVVLAEYGPDSKWAQRGQGRVQYRRLYDLLRTVPALQDAGSDLLITITDPDASILPEHYRYVSAASLSVMVEQA